MDYSENDFPKELEQSWINYLNEKEMESLERHVLAAISKCTIFEYSECKKIYIRTKSFDKTIEIIKLATEQKKSPHIIMDEIGIDRSL